MITLNDILKGKNLESLPKQVKINLGVLLQSLTKLEELWGKPLTVTSGFRTTDDQIRIYKEKALKAGVPFDINKVPLKSKHLIGAAGDLYDPDKKLKQFVKANNYKILVALNLYMESEKATPNWLHVQIIKPLSGSREFNP